METTAAPGYSRSVTYLALALAVGIIALWTLFTPSGFLGKTDAIGYAICHRIEVRSFIAGDYQLPLCARCTGIYLGAMTGLAVFLASGRTRASRFPHWKIIAVLALFVVAMGFDGLNSYFTLFPWYDGLYEPQNWLRLTTGVFCGLALINLVFPLFNQSVWTEEKQQDIPALQSLQELALLCVVAAAVIGLVLLQNPTLLTVLGVISALGVLLVLTMVMAVGITTTLGNFRSYRSWRELALPLVMALALALLFIGAIDWLRYSYTGTWEGFAF